MARASAELFVVALVEDESELLLDVLLLAPCSSASNASCAVLPEVLEFDEEPSLFNSADTASCAESPLVEAVISEFSSCSKAASASCAVSPELDDAVELTLVLELESVDDDVVEVSDEDVVDADDDDELESAAPAQPSVGGGPGGGPGGCGINCANSWLNCCSLTLPVLSGSSLA